MARFRATLVAPNVYSPILFVVVGYQGVPSLASPGILDSGADVTVVPFQLVQTITGQDWDGLPDAPPSTGLSGPQAMKKADLTVAWPAIPDVFCREVLVAPPLAGIPILIGRHDFFTRFMVRFNWSHVPPTFDIEPPVVRAKLPARPRRRRR